MQTKEGAKKATQTNLANDPDYYKRIGSKGGKNSFGYTFAHGKVDPHIVGKLGGQKSRRSKKRPKRISHED